MLGYPLSVRHLHLFRCSRASAFQCSVRPGLVHGKFKNQTYFGYQLPSMHSQTCFSALCDPSTQIPTLLKKIISLYHFSLVNVRKQSLKAPNKEQHLKSSCHSWRSAPGDAVHSLSCHGGFADASAPVRYKTGITTF